MAFLLQPNGGAERDGGGSPETGGRSRNALPSTLSGSFAGGLLAVVEISSTMLTASHRERLTVGRRAPLTLHAGERNRVVLVVRVARSRFQQLDGQAGYVSDFEILEESRETATRLMADRGGMAGER